MISLFESLEQVIIQVVSVNIFNNLSKPFNTLLSNGSSFVSEVAEIETLNPLQVVCKGDVHAHKGNELNCSDSHAPLLIAIIIGVENFINHLSPVGLLILSSLFVHCGRLKAPDLLEVLDDVDVQLRVLIGQQCHELSNDHLVSEVMTHILSHLTKG